MNKIFIFLDIYCYQKKFYKFLYYLFLPIFFVLELIVYWYYWRKIILSEMLIHDEITDFFVRNEFGYKYYKLYKKDIIEPDSSLDYIDINEVPILIKNEIFDALLKLLTKYVTINIEQFINIQVKFKWVITSDGTKIKTYIIDIRFYRLQFIKNDLNYLVWWFLGFGCLSYLVYQLFPMINNTL